MTEEEKFALKRRLRERYSTDRKRVYEIAVEEIDRLRTTENIHGEWKTQYEIIRNPWGDEHNPQTKCSNCNFRVDTYSSRFMNFCPNCGADMRKGEE